MVNRTDTETVVVKEFGPEMAGERVGWSAIYDEGMFEGWTSVNIAAATIGPDGASISYEARDEDGERKILISSDSTQGLLALTGVSIAFDTKKPVSELEPDIEYRSAETSEEGGINDSVGMLNLITKGGAFHAELEQMQARATWVDSMQTVQRNVKQAMEDEGLGEYYPALYYTANVAFAHESALKLPQEVRVKDLLLPDAAMIDETEDQIKIAQTLEDAFTNQIRENRNMKHNLTPYGSLTAADIPHSFEASRRTMHELEKSAFNASKQLHASRGFYLPTGYSFGGRTWPYMDASCSDEDKAFGFELNALREGSTDRPIYELKSEHAELERRHSYAQQGRIALNMLSRAEKDA